MATVTSRNCSFRSVPGVTANCSFRSVPGVTANCSFRSVPGVTANFCLRRPCSKILGSRNGVAEDSRHLGCCDVSLSR